MMERILLPIDGSQLSARAVPVVGSFAQALKSEVVVIEVVEPLAMQTYEADGGGYIPPDTYDQLVAELREQAQADVEAVASQLRASGIRVRTVVLEGMPGSTLLEVEAEENIDLVVMATHGRTGLARIALGSVADRLVREGRAPVLLVRAFTPTPTELSAALVPLDGSDVAEAVLPLAQSLAGGLLRSVHLLQVIDDDDDRLTAQRYLERVAAQLESTGLYVRTYVEVGKPAEAIQAHARDVDIVLLATHGRGGIDRIRHGSVAEEATREVGTPVLLVRARSVTQPAVA